MSRNTLKFNPLTDLLLSLKTETQACVKERHAFTAGGNDEQTIWFQKHHNYGAGIQMTGRYIYFEFFRFSKSDGSVFERKFVVEDELDTPETADRITRRIDGAVAWIFEQ